MNADDVEARFFSSLIGADVSILNEVLTADFVKVARYTHVFVQDQEWRMVSAQGTPIVGQ